MQVELERREGGEVELKISVEPQAVSDEVEKVFKEAASTVQIPGFRPGRAPRTLVEQSVNMDLVRTEAMERLAQSRYLEALAENGLVPIDRAKVEDEKLQDDGSFTFRATVPVIPEVKLGEYKGLKVGRPNITVSDQAVENELERLRQRFLTYSNQPEKPIENGDIAIIDYTLEVEGKEIEEAGVKGYPLQVGADALFSELNEGLMGAKVGEERRVPSKLPSSYPNPDLAGKDAIFLVTVKEVKTRTLPEFDDEFAKSFGDVENMEQLRAKMRDILEKAAIQMSEQTVRDRLIKQVVDASEVELPLVMVEREMGTREDEIQSELQRRGTDLTAYLAQQGRTYKSWSGDLESTARESLKRYLVLREIEKKEDPAVNDEEIEAEIAHLASHENKTPAAKRRELESNDRLDDVISFLKREKVIQMLVDAAEVTLEEPMEQPAAGAAAAEDKLDTEASEHGKE